MKRACIPLPVHMHLCSYAFTDTYVLATPACYERRGTGCRVRSLNFDPEMATARPLCAWPSTTGRRRYVHTIGETRNDRKEVGQKNGHRHLSNGTLHDSNDPPLNFSTNSLRHARSRASLETRN